MKCHSSVLCVSALAFCLASGAFAQQSSPPVLDLALCSPLVDEVRDDLEEQTDEPQQADLTRLYDQEIRESLTDEQEVMDALYEEKWDLATRDPIPRNTLCPGQPNFVVHWADLTGRDETGRTVLLAQGAFSFKKDGTFEFVFDKRPYAGTWGFADGMMTLGASWMNKGQPVTAPVERVQTPVEVRLSDGSTETYLEDGFRVGGMRFLRSETTAPGQFQDCACSG